MKSLLTDGGPRLSRRHFLERSTQSLAAAAFMGPMRKMGLSAAPGPALRLVQDGDSIRCLARKVSVCLIPASAIGGEGETKSPVDFRQDEVSKIERHFHLGEWEIRDRIEQVTPGLFVWHRAWKNVSAQVAQGDFCMEVESGYSPQFFLIPGASYNGNPEHGRTAPQGLTLDGSPWIFSVYRSTVPAGTYSEGAGWSIFLFAAAQRPSIDCACSLAQRNDQIVHRLLWPGRDNVSDRATISQCETAPIGSGESFETVSYLVLWPAAEPRKSWSKGLDTAWQLNRHDMKAWYPPRRLWELGIQFAQESLWYEEPDFVGFNLGLSPAKSGWQQQRKARFEIGWCGQNASLGAAMLQDYLWNKNPESLRKGMRALDFWAENGRLKCGLFYTHFDLKLGAAKWAYYNPAFLGRPAGPSDKFVDTCNLGYGAYFYLLASELAEKCGSAKPAWRQLGLDTCNFFVEHALADGTFGKAWSLDGQCLDEGATTGAYLIWPLLKAYRMTGQARYLAASRRAFRTYVDRDLSQLGCWGGSLDEACIDRESCQPLLLTALDLYEITGEKQYLRDAEMAGYYLASWQWHYSIPFADGSHLAETKYDSFAGSSNSVKWPNLDPWGAFLALGWMRLAKATGNNLWRDRGVQSFKQATTAISDGYLVINGRRRPPGSQNETVALSINKPCGRGTDSDYTDWLVAWPSAFRLITLMHWSKWADFDA
jgi:hypothetical protein